jgi:hypothetical protein
MSDSESDSGQQREEVKILSLIYTRLVNEMSHLIWKQQALSTS